MRFLLTVLIAALLAGCGGGSDDASAYERAVDLANAKEAEARALAVDTPCNDGSQCGTVAFTVPTDPCGMWIYKPYSLVSPTAAAAKQAADEQRELAAHARELGPLQGIACIAIFKLPPALTCVASKCLAAQ
jgi:hypothetical protein